MFLSWLNRLWFTHAGARFAVLLLYPIALRVVNVAVNAAPATVYGG
jgi:hypothetical protein